MCAALLIFWASSGDAESWVENTLEVGLLVKAGSTSVFGAVPSMVCVGVRCGSNRELIFGGFLGRLLGKPV